MLTAASYLFAVRVAGRFGPVNTMVFTHIPSSVCLILLPFFAPDVSYANALLFLRGALPQMDVPTRRSYVMAIVTPEPPAATNVTSVPRSLACAMSPFLAGYMLGLSAFGWPLVVAGGV